ncbi:MAG TPA: hypothetical protein VGM88_27565 [Kofleriaceae bacterium]|jgi:hypothetical protein
MKRALAVLALVACHAHEAPRGPRAIPTPSIQVGACGVPGKDGVMSASPQLQRADRDLNGDGKPESIVADREMCTPEGNCYWNVFVGDPGCQRFIGTFAAAALEPQVTVGDEHMVDIRGYWNLHGGRMLLESYRFSAGGYRTTDALLCRKAADDKIECAESVTLHAGE